MITVDKPPRLQGATVMSVTRRILLVTAITTGGCMTASRPAPYVTTVPAIEQADLRARLSIFADDSMLGRSTNDVGHARAVRYLAVEAARIGLTPAGENGTFLQTFFMRVRKLNVASNIVVDGRVLQPTKDFKVFGTGRGEPRHIEGATVVYGGTVGDSSSQISAEEASHRIVLLGVPGNMTAARAYLNVLYGPQSRFRNAVAVVIASLDYLPVQQRAISESIGLVDSTETLASSHPISILVTRQAAEVLLGSALEHAQAGATGRTVQGHLLVDETTRPARNVIGVLPGTDPVLKHEYVALGAHSDHMGVTLPPLDHDSVRAYAIERARRGPQQGGRSALITVNIDSLRRIRPARLDSILNGADDNGSGSVALLEIAEHLAVRSQRPRRSLLFVWHAEEEGGYTGSGWFVAHPTVPLDSIVAHLNLDMVGRGGVDDLPGGGPTYVELIGADRRSPALLQLIQDVNIKSEQPATLVTTDPNGAFCNSDHWNYARVGIPVAFFTTGRHFDLHSVTDEAAYIDYAKMALVTRLVSAVSVRLANSSERFEPAGRRPSLSEFCSR